jgi:hypothetical protein
MPLLVTDLPSDVPVILGMDFLQKTEPQLDWPTCRLIYAPNRPDPSHVSRSIRDLSDLPDSESLSESDSDLSDSPSLDSDYIPSVRQPAALRMARTTLPTNDLSDFFNPDENPDDIQDILNTVPKEFHDMLDVFSKAKGEALPEHRSYDHKIDLIDEKNLPPLGPIYSTSPNESKVLKEEIDSLLARGAIRASSSPIGAPVLFVKKPHDPGKLRMCIDYRQLNLRTVKNKYPIPPVNFLLEQLTGAKFFSKIDLRGAYHLLRVAEGHEWKTTFRCRYGSFEFLVMPFGLTNAPSSFQHFINEVLHPFVDKFVVVYLDDILIYSKDAESHSRHIREVLEALRVHKLYAKASKCEFFKDFVEFLGYIVGKAGLQMDASKVQPILDWPIPVSVKGVQSFLGFANFYRRFIKNYSKIVSPLTRLTRKDTAFEWTSESTRAFESLKAAFTSAPILVHFDPQREAYLETDASDYAIGSILSQTDENGLLHPVAFDSRRLGPAELNYAIHDKELLAIVWSFQRWRSHLLGAQEQIKVLTDHNALEYFMSSKQLTRRQARWGEILSEYNFVIKYRPGKQSTKPDALSRRDDVYPKEGEGYADSNPHNFKPLLTQQTSISMVRLMIGSLSENTFMEDLRKAQELDSDLRDLLENDSEAPRTTRKRRVPSRTTRDDSDDSDDHSDSRDTHSDTREPSESPIVVTDNGIATIKNKIYVPNNNEIKLDILHMYHDPPLAGHTGRDKTVELIRRRFYWPSVKSFVEDYIASCPACARNKARRHKSYGLLQPLPVPAGPWKSISLDYIEQLPESAGYDSILVIVDRFTKMVVFIPTHTTAKAKDLARIFVRDVISKHGCPSDIISDRGTKFVSKFWKAVCKALGIERKLSTAYHPQTDGQTERINQVLEQYVRMYCAYQQNDWDEWLPLAKLAYNNAPQASTGKSPFFANYGYHPSFDIVDGVSDSLTARDWIRNMDSVHSEIRDRLEKARVYSKRQADKKRKAHFKIELGDKVLLSTKNIRTTRPTRKFSEKYIGPYRVVEQISEVAFKLELPKELSRIHPVFHVSLLEPFRESRTPGRNQPPPPPVELAEPDVYEVEAIVDSRFVGNKLEYKLEWAGYENDPDRYTWEPAENLMDNILDEVEEFHRRHPNKPRVRSDASTSRPRRRK